MRSGMRTAAATAFQSIHKSANETREDVELHTQRARFSDAFSHGFPMTQHFLLSRGASAEVAEEIAQAAWVKGWECRHQLLHPEMLGAWVNSIAKNMLKNSVRMERRFESLPEFTSCTPAIQQTIDFDTVLDYCPRRDFKLVCFYYLEGYTTEEIARKTGICSATVRVRLLRVRRALRDRLQISARHPVPTLRELHAAA
jgi:RNA polymerase sigma factor (sigma-70 family)